MLKNRPGPARPVHINLVLVKNRTSHGSLGSRQTTHAYDTSLETAVKMSAIRCTLYAILQQTKKLSTLVTLFSLFTSWRTCSVLKNIDLSGLQLWNAEVHLNQCIFQCYFKVQCLQSSFCYFVFLVCHHFFIMLFFIISIALRIMSTVCQLRPQCAVRGDGNFVFFMNSVLI